MHMATRARAVLGAAEMPAMQPSLNDVMVQYRLNSWPWWKP